MSKFINLFLLYIVIHSTIACKDEPIELQNELNGRTTAVFNPNKKYGTVSDVDGNVYKTIQIGQQTWMAENLRVTHYRNGDAIPNVLDSTLWESQTTGAYCNYSNTTNLDTIATYGRLYNWYTTQDPRGLAPKGWRVATAEDWSILIANLGGDTIASMHLKETGTLHWDSPNNATNSSGFTAVPGSWRDSGRPFELGFYGTFWSSSPYIESKSLFLYLTTWNINKVYTGANFSQNGYSIRCIKE